MHADSQVPSISKTSFKIQVLGSAVPRIADLQLDHVYPDLTTAALVEA